MEIEKKYLVEKIPFGLEKYPYHEIEQAYICSNPVLRVRKKDNEFIFTYKNRVETENAVNVSDEVECKLDEATYKKLLKKADGNIIKKTRFLIPYGKFTIELDIFHDKFVGLKLAEVEFESEEESASFTPPDWFGEDVSGDIRFTNNYMAARDFV